MRTWGWVAGATAVLVLSGCSAFGAEVIDLDASANAGSHTVASPTASTTSTPPAPAEPCVTVSKAALKAVDLVVRDKGENNTVTRAGAQRDVDSGMWLVVGAFGGPAGAGEGALGIWATAQDPRAADFASPVLAVDGAASQWSIAEPAHDIAYDPAYAPVVVCLPDPS
ncbi:hypothetical protein [Phycicoccus sp. Root563]|uniref:hypothetical protein n=1 Tax=Phycicoccus sp. Root563 TaxID=1736562 RepID=UPI000AC1B28E|nr:hypothetical protein [Phycicoccus sp. Root563]